MAALADIAGLGENLQILSEDEKETAQMLIEAGQTGLFAEWDGPGEHDEDKKSLLAQAKLLNTQYGGGLKQYVENAVKLLESSALGHNPFEGWIPSVPLGERLQFESDQFGEMEKLGLDQLSKTAFVLVAGGLGERLGYHGIKIALPVDIITETCYLRHYAEYMLAYQAHARKLSGDDSLIVPLTIMTSGDTDEKTVKLLEDNSYFGLADGQCRIVKQEKVPSLRDNKASFAMNSPYEISTKPHGHGDVHTLLHQSGTIKRWMEEGKKWIVFFQDTNAMIFRSIPAGLGVSAHHEFQVNTLTVPRRPGEAVGSICGLAHEDGRKLTCNVEYNQLDPLLRATISPEGDTPDESGYSPFPGNTNVLIFAIDPYSVVLDVTNGMIPEFVNPKYKDETKTSFKKPTRLECMMQDYPKLLDKDAKVGFTQLERWVSFSAVKNNIVDAKAKYEKSGFAECASEGETNIYYANRRFLKHAGVDILDEQKEREVFAGVPTRAGARVVLTPSFGVTREEIASKFSKDGKVKISSKSTLVLDGENIFVENLDLDGSLVIKAPPEVRVTVKNLTVKNEGSALKAIDHLDESIDEKYRIRGYVLNVKEEQKMEYRGGENDEVVIDE